MYHPIIKINTDNIQPNLYEINQWELSQLKAVKEAFELQENIAKKYQTADEFLTNYENKHIFYKLNQLGLNSAEIYNILFDFQYHFSLPLLNEALSACLQLGQLLFYQNFQAKQEEKKEKDSFLIIAFQRFFDFSNALFHYPDYRKHTLNKPIKNLNNSLFKSMETMDFKNFHF